VLAKVSELGEKPLVPCEFAGVLPPLPQPEREREPRAKAARRKLRRIMRDLVLNENSRPEMRAGLVGVAG